MNKKDQKAYETLVDHAQPFITLSTVIDKDGYLLSLFHFHPQFGDEITITLDKCSTDQREIHLDPDEVREFADDLKKFADCCDTIVHKYHERNQGPITL